MTKMTNEIRKAEPLLEKQPPKILRTDWVTRGVNDLGISKHVIAKANGREDVVVMDKHYVADTEAEEAEEAHDNVGSAIAKLGNGS